MSKLTPKELSRLRSAVKAAQEASAAHIKAQFHLKSTLDELRGAHAQEKTPKDFSLADGAPIFEGPPPEVERLLKEVSVLTAKVQSLEALLPPTTNGKAAEGSI